MPHHPLAGYLHGHLLTCYRDYWPYRQHQPADYQCWAMDLDRLDKQWTSLPTPSHTLWYSAAVAGDDKFLIMGGSENYSDYMEDMNGTRHVQEYDMVTGGWSSGVPLPFPLFEGCAVNTESGIVVLGDFEGGPFNAYILVDEQWHPLPPSTFYHANLACAQVTVSSENVLIALSGQNIEYFSFVQNKWIKMKPPDVKRS